MNQSLLPAGEPSFALTCSYSGFNGTAFRLTAHHRLTQASARHLAALAGQVSLSTPQGVVVHCPADTGEVTVIAFSYPARPDVDLWYRERGCSSLANGKILTGFDNMLPFDQALTSTSHITGAWHPPGVFGGPITTTILYQEAGVTLEPPRQQHAAVSPSVADKSCSTGDSVCPMGHTALINLAVASTALSGTMQTNGTITPLVARTLVYVMTWTGVPCVASGGPMTRPGNAESRSPVTHICTVVSLVDAKSGAFLFGFDGTTP